MKSLFERMFAYLYSFFMHRNYLLVSEYEVFVLAHIDYSQTDRHQIVFWEQVCDFDMIYRLRSLGYSEGRAAIAYRSIVNSLTEARLVEETVIHTAQKNFSVTKLIFQFHDLPPNPEFFNRVYIRHIRELY